MEIPVPSAMDVRDLLNPLHAMANRIASYLDAVVRSNGGFPARVFYGESFAVLLMSQYGAAFAESISALTAVYATKPKDDSQFHWEFNKYAWVNMHRQQLVQDSESHALPLRFKNTQVTNWTLLRSCTRFLAAQDQELAGLEARAVLRRHQASSGLISDDNGVRSLQYHCFSATLAAEIYELSGQTFFRDRFHRSADFICHLVLRSGDSLYFGRGQEQSFGYGALIYLLALAYKHFRNSKYLVCLKRCTYFLAAHQRQDGSFPLVLNDVEEGFPTGNAAQDEKFPGWYQYNNYFDYLPFLGVYLHKAATSLAEFTADSMPTDCPEMSYRDRDVLVHRTDAYEAVVSRPGGGWSGSGYWTNDLPIPYISCRHGRVTPCYGGEQYGSNLYRPEGIPLPLVKRGNDVVSIRKGRVWSVLLRNTLVVLSPSGLLFRRFRFEEQCVRVDDFILSPFQIFANYLFETIVPVNEYRFTTQENAIISFSTPMAVQEGRKLYCCRGPLIPVVSRRPVKRVRMMIALEGQL